MGAIVGFLLGYAFGTRAGEGGWSQLLESWQKIASSDEFKDLLTEGLNMAPDFLRQGAGALVERLGKGGGAPG